jgi:hypothetical protein
MAPIEEVTAAIDKVLTAAAGRAAQKQGQQVSP